MKIIKKRKKENKWTLHLYYKNQEIKKIKVNEEFKPLEEYYILKIFFKKYLFGSNFVKIIFKFDKLKYTNEDKKEMYIELMVWEGVRK